MPFVSKCSRNDDEKMANLFLRFHFFGQKVPIVRPMTTKTPVIHKTDIVREQNEKHSVEQHAFSISIAVFWS